MRPLSSFVIAWVIAVCVAWSASAADWDWYNQLAPLKRKQVELKVVRSVGAVYKAAREGDWPTRVAAVLRLGEMRSPASVKMLMKVADTARYNNSSSAPPDVDFFAPAVMGSTGLLDAKVYLMEWVRTKRRTMASLPKGSWHASFGSRWLGAFKGLSYYKDTAVKELCDAVAKDHHVDATVRMWACEASISISWAFDGVKSSEDKVLSLVDGLSGQDKTTVDSTSDDGYADVMLSARRDMLIRLARGSNTAAAAVEASARRVRDANTAKLLKSIVPSANSSRRLLTPVDELGRF